MFWLELIGQYAQENVVTVFLGVMLMFMLIVKQLSKTTERNQPPGPDGYPIFGIFPKMIRKPAYLTFDDWTKTYGNVFRFKLGGNAAVVLGDADLVRNTMLSKDSAVDSRVQWRETFINTFKGISVLPYNRKWANTRGRTMKILKDLGVGKEQMEIIVNKEIDNLFEALLVESKNGEVNIAHRNYFRRSPMNIICFLTFGERFDYNSPKCLATVNLVTNIVNLLEKASIFDILPKKLRGVFGFSLNHFYEHLNKFSRWIDDNVEDAKEKKRTENIRSFVSEWIKEIENEEKRAQNGDSVARKETSLLAHVITDVIIAGGHSTGILLNWIVLFLIVYPEEQEKIFEELADVVGLDRPVKDNDRVKLVQMDAFIHESHRIATILPLVGHANWLDIEVNGYHVPKNSEVIYNNWTINRDERVFPDPFAFKPDRWINEEGKIRNDLQQKFFPFGIGKRSCAGIKLAKMEIFLTTANIVQRLHILPPDETVSEDMKPAVIHKNGLLLECKPFLARFKAREDSLQSYHHQQ